MNKYFGNKASEEEYKAKLHSGLFKNFEYSPNFEGTRIDFTLLSQTTQQHLLWAEVKNERVGWLDMLTQLVLTIHGPYFGGLVAPPPYLAVIDTESIWFFKLADLVGVLARNDVNWKTTPSNYKADAFGVLCKILDLNVGPFREFSLEDSKDIKELKQFIKDVLETGIDSPKIEIQLANVNHVFNKWSGSVLKNITLTSKDWQELAKVQIYPADFFLADLLFCPESDYTSKEELSVIQTGKFYMLAADRAKALKLKDQFYRIKTIDNWKAYKNFWSGYQRPPEESEGTLILTRRDLLVPQDVRERKGAFFTPKIWVDKAHEYLAKALGENWQDEHYVYDCAAGTGNLLFGLKDSMKARIFASTLDQPDVEIMKTETKPTFESNIFQFDFLNDDFIRKSEGGKVPDALMDILEDPEKRKKLVFLINPPYAESGSAHGLGVGIKHKSGVTESKIKDKYANLLGKAQREISVQFIVRIISEFKGCKLAEFSTLKTQRAKNQARFREYFMANLLQVFLVPAYTFDGVTGQFPVGCKIWDTGEDVRFLGAVADVFNDEGILIGRKEIIPYKHENIDVWLKNQIKVSGSDWGMIDRFFCLVHHSVGYSSKTVGQSYSLKIENEVSIEAACIYYAAKYCRDFIWVNDQDQWFYPTVDPLLDVDFVKDCLIFTCFDKQNQVSVDFGPHHWLPFPEHLLGITKAPYTHHTMLNYFKQLDIPNALSPEAAKVYEIAFEIFEYYHSYGPVSPCGKFQYNHEAALYDIRKFFQGTNAAGRMNPSSKDCTYQRLIKNLRAALKELRDVRISPKVYQYGFLK